MAKMTAEFHLAFNLVLAILLVGLLDPIAKVLVRVFPPARKNAADSASPRYLDVSALETPSLALADAAR
jgi:phosphate:Na+ symporter